MANEKPSIAYVVDGTFKSGEGGSRYVETLGNYFEEQGHKVDYIVGDTDRQASNIHTLGGKNRKIGMNGNDNDFALYSLHTPTWRLQRQLDRVNPDILHVQMPYNPFLGSRYINLAERNTAVVATFHIVPNSTAEYIGIGLLASMIRKSTQRIDRMIAVSDPAKYLVRDTFGIDAAVIPPPIDLDVFRKGQRIKEYDDDKTNIVFMGRLVERKGPQHLVAAVAALEPAVREKIRVLIAGKGSMTEELKSTVKRLGLDKTIEFLGFVPDEKEADTLATADIAVFPATGGESFGIILAEAMASRARTVVGGNNRGYRYALGGYGANTRAVLFDPVNTPKFAHFLANLINNPSERDEIYDQQQKLVESYGIQVVGPKTATVYDQSLADRRS